jgi:flagellar hook assembly protein FlgD/outer membrane protein OmpA-like peptidoglycan-associated protein
MWYVILIQFSIPLEGEMRRVTHTLRLLTCAGLFAAGGTLFAIGTGEVPAPEITTDLEETTYISPGITDGVQDLVDFVVTIQAADRLVIKGYSVTVTDESGVEVYANTNSVTEEDPFFNRMMIAIGFAGLKSPVTVPDVLSWNGTDSDGAPVPEGTYSLVVAGWDDKEGAGSSSTYAIVVDNTPPSVELTFPYAIFSPNGDANQDIMIIEHTAGSESKWSSVLQDTAGSEILRFDWTDSEPQNVTWDGKNTSGETVSDGVYSYYIKGSDLAGNSYQTTYSPITVDTRDTPVSVSRDLAYFSPNNDGSQDTLEIIPVVPLTEGIKSWTLTISGTNGRPARVYSGVDSAPEATAFDGMNDSGTVLAEGSYNAELSVLYTNGNNPVAKTESFAVDLTPPSVALRTNPRIISPNGDGRQDRLEIFQEASNEEIWNATVTDLEGNLVRNVSWRGTPDQAVNWDGLDDLGTLVPNGNYVYTLSARDRGGNYSEAVSESIKMDLRDTPVALSIEGAAFSPNSDSKKDSIAVIPNITDQSGIKQLTVTFYDSTDTAVRTLSSQKATENLTWDGRTDSGRVAPDGSYLAKLIIAYDNGNAPEAKAGPVIIDTRYPSLKISADNPYFSPDGDGNGDALPIKQIESSSERLWSAAVLDAEMQPVKTFLWTGRAESFTWDGADEDGNLLPDGEYRYAIESTDEAGNRSVHTIERITIDTRETAVALRISGTAFSPNGDGSGDTLIFEPHLDIADNVAEWKIEVHDSADVVRRSFSGSSLPLPVAFDGNDAGGNPMPEGSYRGNISILYKNGNNPTARSGEFSIDNSPPLAEVSSSTSVLSPNGDGRKDSIKVSQSGSEEDQWRGIVSNQEGEAVRTITWFGELGGEMEWDGKNDEGKLTADGTYTYKLVSTDRAGNTGGSAEVAFRKDTRDTSLAFAADLSAFSPNGDGQKDQIIFEPQIGLDEGIMSYTYAIENLDGKGIYTETKSTPPPDSFGWSGHAADGFRVPDGTYKAKLILAYEHGNEPEVYSALFDLDTKLPTLAAAVEYKVFSPDGDGRKDEIRVTQETSEENLWEGLIRDADSGASVASFFWKGIADDLAWDGKDSAGNIAPNGLYIYEIFCTDDAGNSIRGVVDGIKLDNRKTSGFVNPAATAFSPNGDGSDDVLRVNLYASPSDGISSWSLAIEDSSGRSVRSFSGTGASMPAYTQWDGKRPDGSIIDGSYNASLRVEYEKGNLIDVESARGFLLDATAPEFTFRASPSPFSPDDDGENDTVSLSIDNIKDSSSILEWSLLVKDPKGKLFFTRSGRGAPTRTVTWNGKSGQGELVQAAEDYPVTVSVTDSLGNMAVKESVIPVDVLVFREGDRLKIRISSIEFAPNSPDFLDFNPEKAERNMKTLGRLAEILQKYSAYQIRIEGHAVSVYWDNLERAKREEAEELLPLSTARAEAVKAVLVDLGIAERRMTAVGLGGSQPFVPHGDLENRWKSRRVEFILVK